MPTISMFYGIIIRMYANDHEPKHFHALYQGNEATFDFNGDIRQGVMPNKQRKIISAWAQIHTDELEANWVLSQNKEELFRIDSLR